MTGRMMLERRFASQEKRAAAEADNRRKMLKRMDPLTRELATREFAKFGLFQ